LKIPVVSHCFPFSFLQLFHTGCPLKVPEQEETGHQEEEKGHQNEEIDTALSSAHTLSAAKPTHILQHVTIP
jgi:hypothetical protein